MMRAFLLAGFGLFLLAAPAAGERLSLRYEGRAYGVLPFGTAEIDVEKDGETVRAEARIASGGLAVLFTRARISAQTTGALTPHGFRSATFALDHLYGDTHRLTDLTWTPEGVTRTVRPEPGWPGDPPPSQTQKLEARDPLGTLVAMGFDIAARGRCGGTYRVYDGRYIYDVRLQPQRTDRFRGAGLDTPALVCALDQTRIAGYRRRADLAKKLPDAEIWFAKDGAQFSAPLDVRSSLPLGVASVRLSALSRKQ